MREEVVYAIFLYLHKVYDALYRYICLDILEGYGVGPQACRILYGYWDRLNIVSFVEIYYRTSSKGLPWVA